MSNRARITIKQTQRLSLNAGLVASIKLLSSDAVGLSRFLEEAAEKNPSLLVGRPPATEWTPRWTGAFRQMASGGVPVEGVADEASPSLAAHVEAGVSRLRLVGAEAVVARGLMEALEPTGWLGRPLAQIAAEAGVSEAAAEAVLRRVQGIEPAGLFARDLAECLTLQAAEEGWLTPLAQAVLAHLPMVAAGATERIARLALASEDQVRGVIAQLRGLDPKPGARFAPCAAQVREPDLMVRRGAAGWEVSLNHSALPTVQVAAEKGPGRAEARALLRLVAGRNATLLKVAQEVLARQSAALEEGVGALQPMTMADVAQALGMNQSTISRAVAGVAMDTPRGTWWLRALFSQAIRGTGPSAASLREAVSRMVAAEDPAQPMSDEALSQALAGAGAPVARRTVAKYRTTLGIPPAHLRRKGDRNGRSQR